MVNLSGVQLRRSMKVQYVNETGEDAGGLFRDWINALSEFFAETLFEEFGDEGMVISKEFIRSDPSVLSLYRFFGRFFGMVLFHCQTMSLTLAPPFFALLLGNKIMLEEIRESDPANFNRIINHIDSDMDEERWEYEYDDWADPAVDGKSVKRFVSVSPDHKVTDAISFDCRKKWAVQYLQYRIGRSPHIMNAIREGINEVIPFVWLELFEPNEMKRFICGESNLDIAQWKEYTVVHAKVDQQSVGFFWRWLEEGTEQDREKMLKFVSGRKRTPAGGFQNAFVGLNRDGKMLIEPLRGHEAEDRVDACPTSATCSARLYLPKYSSFEKFKYFVELAMNSAGFNII